MNTPLLLDEDTVKSVRLEYANGLSLRDVGAHHGVSRTVIRRYVADILRPKNFITLEVNSRAFSDPLDMTSAYWAGLIAADGCILLGTKCTTYAVNLTLHRNDSQHLERFQKWIKTTAPISMPHKYKRASIEFRDAQVADDLARIYNLRPRKTLCLEPPCNLPTGSIAPYVRGVFDGDGCISITGSGRRSGRMWAEVKIVGTLPLLEWIRSYTPDLGYISRDRKQFALRWTSFAALDPLFQWMYAGSDVNTRLDRKYDKFVRVVNSRR